MGWRVWVASPRGNEDVQRAPTEGESVTTVEIESVLAIEELTTLLEAAESSGQLRQLELTEVLEPLELDPLETEAVYQELGSPELAGNTHSLADLALDRGDHATAMTLYRQALLSADGRERRFPAYCLAGIASVLAESGRDDEAALAWGSVCATEQSHGFRMVAWERRRYERRLARFEGTHAWSSGRALSIDAAVDALGLR